MEGEHAVGGLALALRRATRSLHVQAETSGFVADMLGGRATRSGYALYLRNLLPAYQALEAALERHRRTPGVQAFARPEIYRSRAIEADLAGLCGPDWVARSPLLPDARDYADRIAAAAAAPLIGHAYVRYLGDLSGGQVLKRLLAKSLGLTADMLSFYDFPDIHDINEYKNNVRHVLDATSSMAMDQADVVGGAVEAFSINIRLSEAVKAAAPSLDDETV